MYARVEALAPGYHADTRRANLAAARGDTRAAYAALERAAADAERRGMTPELIAWCHLRAGGLAWEHGDWPRAERSYTAARALTPESPVVVEHLAELRAAQGRDEEALELYARALDLSPQPEFYEAVGEIHRRRGRADEAARSFAQARAGYEQAARDGDPGAYRLLALFLLEVEPHPADALAWARKDVGIRQDAVTLGILAWALLKNGLEEEAGRIADTAIQAGPVDADTWYRAGVVSVTLGDRAAARTRLRRALAINPRFRAAADAARLLKRVADAEVHSVVAEGKIAVNAGEAITPFEADPAQQPH
jgi:tetratricopeptide (TPR) repeat protein